MSIVSELLFLDGDLIWSETIGGIRSKPLKDLIDRQRMPVKPRDFYYQFCTQMVANLQLLLTVFQSHDFDLLA